MMLVFIWVFQASLLALVSCALDGWESLGCWRDLPFRAIASLEGKSKHLSKNWKNRTDPLTSCAEAAAVNKFKVFAVQDGGQCFGGQYAQFFFDQYGPSNLCKGGLGGKWSSDVYSSKTAFQRVLNEEKADQKPIKCSKPLDLVFLVDGSGGSSLENKLRWSEMLKFISKTTEEFDPDTTRFGVLRYGSSPKVIVNMTDNRDVLSMRDTLMTEKFPGGKRTINDAMKTAWKDLFKQDKRIANKVIVALTAGTLPYGPWGSTLFLTGRNIRVMAFGIDKEPTYRYLESIASWKRPENIYSLDSDQLLKSVPFVTKDICTGSKKQQVETVKKDKEIELFESNEFETVGSAVERQLERKSNMKNDAPMRQENGPARSENQDSSEDGESTKSVNQPKKSAKTVKPDRKTVSKKKHHKLTNVIKTSEAEKPGMSDSRIVQKQEENAADDFTFEHETAKSVEKSYKSLPDIDTFMYTGNAAVRDKTGSKDESLSSTQADLNATNAVEAPLMPVTPQNTENNTSYPVNKNEFRSTDEVKNEVTEIQTRTEDGASPTSGSGTRNDSEISVEKEALQKIGPSQQRITQTKEPVIASAEEPYSNRMLSNEARKPEKSPSTQTEKQAENAATSNSAYNKNENKLILNANATETHRNAESASLEKQNTSALPNMKAKEISAVNESLKNQTNDGLPVKNYYKAGNKSNKDIDREVFSSIQKERDSFGEEDDEPSVLSSDKDVIRDSADFASKDEKIAEDAAALVNDDPYDPVATDSDTMTQRALEQKKKEIDILLKKLDENRRRKHRKRKRRKIRFSKFYDSKDSMSDESFDNDIHDDIERNELAKGHHEAAPIQNDEMLQGQGNVEISPKHSYEGNEESLLSTGNVGLKNLEKQSHLRHIVEQDLPTNIKEDEAFETKQRADVENKHSKSLPNLASLQNNFGTKRNLTSYNPEDNAKSFKKSSSLFGADEFGEVKEAKDFLATKSDEIGKDTTEESPEEAKKTSTKLSTKSVNSSEKKASDKEVKASSKVEKTSVQEAKESEKDKKESEEASNKVEKTSDKAESSSDKAETSSDKGEESFDKQESSPDKEEKTSQKAEKSSVKAVKSSDKADSSSDKQESSSDKQESSSDKEAKTSQKAEMSSDKAAKSSEKQESSSDKQEKSSVKAEKSSKKAEKTSRKTAKTSFRHQTENASHSKHEKRYKESVQSQGNMSFESSSQVSRQDDVLSKMQRDVTGCNRPMKVLYVVDVSEGIGTGPARKRRWDHLKRFLRTVNDKITHGGNMGYVVYDSEPRFISNLEPCDESTEYFVTSGECLCDKRAASYREGQSACTTHAPTLDESIEDWGAQGPRTAKALQLARRYFRDEAFGNAKKLIVLLTHQTSTDDVTSAEKDLKDDSISLVDIEIGERHNLRKRSSNFDEVIPRDHQMEVSFYKLDRAIEKIVKKICSEKNPSKVRRSRIHASMKHRRDRWK